MRLLGFIHKSLLCICKKKKKKSTFFSEKQNLLNFSKHLLTGYMIHPLVPEKTILYYEKLWCVKSRVNYLILVPLSGEKGRD